MNPQLLPKLSIIVAVFIRCSDVISDCRGEYYGDEVPYIAVGFFPRCSDTAFGSHVVWYMSWSDFWNDILWTVLPVLYIIKVVTVVTQTRMHDCNWKKSLQMKSVVGWNFAYLCNSGNCEVLNSLLAAVSALLFLLVHWMHLRQMSVSVCECVCVLYLLRWKSVHV